MIQLPLEASWQAGLEVIRWATRSAVFPSLGRVQRQSIFA